MRLSGLLMRAAVAAVRGWTRLYTWGMPAACAEERQAEIDSDLWELQHDSHSAHDVTMPLHALVRLVGGVADDVWWRLEHRSSGDSLVVRTAAAATAAAIATVLWIWPMSFDWRAIGGRRQIAACADALPAPQSSTDVRLQIVQCAGAFFAPRRP